MRHGFNVCRIYAAPDATEVVTLKPGWNRPSDYLVHDPVDALVVPSFPPRHAIASAID